MTMNCGARTASNLVHALRCSKSVRLMLSVADLEGSSVPDVGETSKYATAQHQIYQFDGIRHPSPSGFDPSFFLPGLKQST
jgi:hypothetical protein